MANHVSAKKRTRQNAKRAIINSANRNRIRTFVKKVELALSAGDAAAAEEAFKAVQPELQKGVTKGVIHKKTASRKLSRLSARIKAAKSQ
ncbi:MAG TPA: 30S ribosomal protein S20 [Alphaproteobacteria bacterium]|nr:30S ribosomal protein S20 [Alphaproteobacteria bacterium]HOO52602.1 30S ribosomal protein S20 [Alphaproteobacteria bacterium]